MRQRQRLYRAVVTVLCLLLAGLIWLDYARRSTDLAGWQEESEREAHLELVQRNTMREKYKIYAGKFSAALPGIVCWGDGYVKGKGRSYFPRLLKEEIETSFFGEINAFLTRGIQNYNFHSLRIPVKDRSSSLESFETITARAGARKFLLAEELVLPRKPDPIELRLLDSDGKEVLFAARPDRHYRFAVLGGIQGYLYDLAQNKEGFVTRLAFGRKITGEEQVILPAGTPLELEETEADPDSPMVLFFGDRGEAAGEQEEGSAYSFDADVYIERQEAVLANLKDKNQPYLLIGRAERGSSLDQALSRHFGEHYLRTDFPQLDEAQEEDYRRLAKMAASRMESLGYFDKAVSVARECMEEMG